MQHTEPDDSPPLDGMSPWDREPHTEWPGTAKASFPQQTPTPPRQTPTALLAERLYRLRPDRAIIACGTFVAAIAVAVGFATAGGASAPARHAPTSAVCAAPASRH
jgi:hypothetical protein